MNNKALRDACNECLPKISDYATELAPDERLYGAYRILAERADFSALTTNQQKAIHNALRDLHLAGVYLPAAHKRRYKTIQQRLSPLEGRFEENLLDATQAWHKHLSDRGDSRPAMELFQDFRRRPPAIEALLRHRGLAA